MPLPQATKIELTPRQKQELEEISSKQTAEYRLVQRAKMILLASDGFSNSESAQYLHIKRDTVNMWRNRWDKEGEKLLALEQRADQKDFRDGIISIVADKPRPGAPVTFTAEQVCQIIAIATTPPEELGVPLTHWSASELRQQVLKRQIIPSISTRTVGRFLKSGGLETSSDQKLGARGNP